MKFFRTILIVICSACTGWAATNYVSLAGSNTAPFDTWATAAHTIQAAVEAVGPGDTVLVTNGTYAAGGAVVNGVSNRVVVKAEIFLESVNGPEHTIIAGDGTVGPNGLRCVYLSEGATLDGFTLSDGNTLDTGGIEDTGGGLLIERDGMAVNCILRENNAIVGGGAALLGGGVLRNVLVIGNAAKADAGGVYCLEGGRLENCTVYTNSAVRQGGGVYCQDGGVVENSIVRGNQDTKGSPEWFDDGARSAFTYSCTTPLAGLPDGTGCIDGDPRFRAAGDPRLGRGSPCIDTGSNTVWMTGAIDLRGNPRIASDTVDMGAYEFYALPVIGITTPPATVFGEVTEYVIGGTNNAAAFGAIAWSNAANGVTGSVAVSGVVYILPAIPLAFGENDLTVTTGNGYGDLAVATLTVLRRMVHGGPSPIHYVAKDGSDTWPYITWATAARNIEDAVQTAWTGDTVRVREGTYYPEVEIELGEGVTLNSVNGSGVTIVDGNNAHRLVTMAQGSVLDGFTLTKGRVLGGTQQGDFRGGAVHNTGGTIQYCQIYDNGLYAIFGDAGDCLGGGVYNEGGIVQFSSISDNELRAGPGDSLGVGEEAGYGYGGGIYSLNGIVRNCRIIQNRCYGGGASGFSHGGDARGGGIYASGGTVENCHIYDNLAMGGLGGNTPFAHGGTGRGGGVFGAQGTIDHCTITGNDAAGLDNQGFNQAFGWGGGVTCNGGVVRNSIVYSNAAEDVDPNWSTWITAPLFDHCCTTPLPAGTDHVGSSPSLMSPSSYVLNGTSPCIDRAMAPATVSNDLEGTSRPLDGNADGSALPDIGAYEYAHLAVDTDGDGLGDRVEVLVHGSDPTSTDSDGDGRDDGDEVNAGFDPARDESHILAAGAADVTNDPAAYGLYTADSIMDLDLGLTMLQVSNSMLRLQLQMVESTNLPATIWMDVGPPVEWQFPAVEGKSFYRVHGSP